MNNIKLILYHPDLNLISDRTFRGLLKKLSALSREIQAQEVLALINQSELNRREKQSLRDRVSPQLNHSTSYYIEKVERGSLELTIAFTAFGIWLLQTTVGKSVEEAWRETEFHKWIIEFLTSGRRESEIERNIEIVIENWSFDRFYVEDVRVSRDDVGDIQVDIALLTYADIEEQITEERIDIEFVVDNGKKIIEELESRPDEDDV